MIKLHVCGITNVSDHQLNIKSDHSDCDQIFHSSQVKWQILLPTIEQSYQCERCNRSLLRHNYPQRNHTIKGPNQIDACNQSLIKRNHTVERPHQCIVCNRTFIRDNHLQRHHQLMHVKLPYQCDVCSRSFSRFEHLQLHRQIHTVKELFVCNLCNRSFVKREHLQRHLSVHNFVNLYGTDHLSRVNNSKTLLTNLY